MNVLLKELMDNWQDRVSLDSQSVGENWYHITVTQDEKNEIAKALLTYTQILITKKQIEEEIEKNTPVNSRVGGIDDLKDELYYLTKLTTYQNAQRSRS